MSSSEVALPPDIQRDVEIAVRVLISHGAREVYLFGSVAARREREGSDIDIAAVGLPKDRFFAAYGHLLMEMQHNVDLVGLDYDSEFARELREHGVLLRVA